MWQIRYPSSTFFIAPEPARATIRQKPCRPPPHKKVIVRRNRGPNQTDILNGYLALNGFVRNRAAGSGGANQPGIVDLLDLDGHVLPYPLSARSNLSATSATSISLTP